MPFENDGDAGQDCSGEMIAQCTFQKTFSWVSGYYGDKAFGYLMIVEFKPYTLEGNEMVALQE